MDTQRLPRAYSYVRFSTPEQAKGHSLQRQTDAARAWAAVTKVTLDDELTFQDKGVSGFTGANRETGELGVFLERKRVFYRTGYARGWPRRRVTPGPSSVIGTAWLT